MPNDNESPDHAGLTEDEALEAAGNLARYSNLTGRKLNALTELIAHLVLGCYRKGVEAQSAELATLRGDNAEFQKEVNALAGQVQSLRYWLASGYCDCEDKDVKSSIPDSLERDWHHEVCEYRQRIEIMNGWQEPVEAK